MDCNNETTERGFGTFTFKDYYGMDCSLQESSLATEDAIWLGISQPKAKIHSCDTKEGGDKGWIDIPIPNSIHIPTRMHLTREQVKELIPKLQKFVDTGSL